MIAYRTRRNKRYNNERMLSFSGTKQLDFTGVTYTHFSCWINVRSQNGNFIGTQTVASLGIPNGRYQFIYGTATGNILGSNGDEDYEVSNLVLYDREPTTGEMQSFRHSGGVVPSQLRANVKAHYTLSERYHPQADSDFIANHTQFSINDFYAIDSSELYGNTPVHAKLLNYSTNELGTINRQDNTAIINTRTKVQDVWWQDNGGVPDTFNGSVIDANGKLDQTHYFEWATGRTFNIPLAAADSIGADKFTCVAMYEIDTFSSPENLFRFVYSPDNHQFYNWVQNSTQDSISQFLRSGGQFNRMIITDGGLNKPYIIQTTVVDKNRFLKQLNNYTFIGGASQSGITSPVIAGTSEFRLFPKTLNWIRLTFYRGDLTIKQHSKLLNNGLLGSTELDSFLDYVFNPGNFYVDGTEVKMRDSSGNGHDAIIGGYAGATAADQLNDLLTNVKNKDLLI